MRSRPLTKDFEFLQVLTSYHDGVCADFELHGMRGTCSAQTAIQCDGCFRWNHRICNTGKFSTLLHLLLVFEFAAYIL